MKSNQWAFNDLPNVAVIVNLKILRGQEWIAYVSHDSDDGAWQFHTSSQEPPTEGEVAVVSLESIVRIDCTIADLADLPFGWHAWRDSKGEPWKRAKM
ncbi:hypothetical protein [Burkholderia perseverans]|uniref:hypothetical protein n=1 Tax=Burkholderia perseverans TaxID=2615214 RepID=UPI001FEFB491|nr:hypothetical protein [Burkholderia perseverans]